MVNSDAVSRTVSEDLEAVFATAAPAAPHPDPRPQTAVRMAPKRRRNDVRYVGALGAAVLVGVTAGAMIPRLMAKTEQAPAPVATAPNAPLQPALRGPAPPQQLQVQLSAAPEAPAMAEQPTVDTAAPAEPALARARAPVSLTRPAAAVPARVAPPPRPAPAAPILRQTSYPRTPVPLPAAPLPVAPLRRAAVPAPIPATVEAACPGPSCNDEEVLLAEEELRDAYRTARRAGVPQPVLQYDRQRWAETREAAAARSRAALLWAYRTHTEDVHETATSALRGPEAFRPDRYQGDDDDR